MSLRNRAYSPAIPVRFECELSRSVSRERIDGRSVFENSGVSGTVPVEAKALANTHRSYDETANRKQNSRTETVGDDVPGRKSPSCRYDVSIPQRRRIRRFDPPAAAKCSRVRVRCRRIDVQTRAYQTCSSGPSVDQRTQREEPQSGPATTVKSGISPS